MSAIPSSSHDEPVGPVPPAPPNARSKRRAGDAGAEARIGPNSLLQTFRALRELEGEEAARAIRARAGLPEAWPEGMVSEAWFVQLIQAVRETLPGPRAEAVLRRSGTYTADYVGQNRIPAPFRGLLRVLPGRVGIPLLLAAFRRHAWTFAGAGRFSAEGSFPGTIVLEGCPTCRAETAGAVHGHAGAYYEAAFEGLLGLAARRVRVREVACQADHAPQCRFEITFDDLTAGVPCASS